MSYNPIPDLVQLGYTWREAAFLYLVGRNSGFFLGRQYSRYLERKPGALIQQLIERAGRFGHIATLEYGQRRHVYHLKSRTVYRLIGEEESRNRHAKSDHEIKTRLMVLDYILEHLPSVPLTDELEKCEFFAQALGLAEEHLPVPAPSNRAHATVRHFLDCFPIYAPQEGSLRTETIRFTYFDHGTCTVKPFQRHLQRYAPLLEKLVRFEVVYVAVSPRNFAAADKAFSRMYPVTPIESRLLPKGLDHLVEFFNAQQLWDGNSPKFTTEHLHVLREGERLYIAPEHEELRSAWTLSRIEFDRTVAQICGKVAPQGVFTALQLPDSYPVFGARYHGKPVRPVAESQIEAISELSSIAS